MTMGDLATTSEAFHTHTDTPSVVAQTQGITMASLRGPIASRVRHQGNTCWLRDPADVSVLGSTTRRNIERSQHELFTLFTVNHEKKRTP